MKQAVWLLAHLAVSEMLRHALCGVSACSAEAVGPTFLSNETRGHDICYMIAETAGFELRLLYFVIGDDNVDDCAAARPIHLLAGMMEIAQSGYVWGSVGKDSRKGKRARLSLGEFYWSSGWCTQGPMCANNENATSCRLVHRSRARSVCMSRNKHVRTHSRMIQLAQFLPHIAVYRQQPHSGPKLNPCEARSSSSAPDCDDAPRRCRPERPGAGAKLRMCGHRKQDREHTSARDGVERTGSLMLPASQPLGHRLHGNPSR